MGMYMPITTSTDHEHMATIHVHKCQFLLGKAYTYLRFHLNPGQDERGTRVSRVIQLSSGSAGRVNAGKCMQ